LIDIRGSVENAGAENAGPDSVNNKFKSVEFLSNYISQLLSYSHRDEKRFLLG